MAEDGTPLWRFADAQGVWRYPVTLADVSPRYLQALIHYEDRWFWDHPGVNPLSIARAAWQDLTSGRVISGAAPHHAGSSPTRSSSSHLWRQAAAAMASAAAGVASVKNEILTLYLNRAPFGGTLQGSARLAGPIWVKSPAQLSYGEAALLAVLPQAPSRLRPTAGPSGRRRHRLIKSCCEWKARAVAVQPVREALEEPVWLFPRQMPQLALALPPPRWRAAAQQRRWSRRWMPGYSGSWKIWR